MIVLALLACTGPDTGEPVEVEPPMAVVSTVADDYSTGALSLVSLEDGTLADAVLPTSGDPQVVIEEGVLYLLERDAAASVSAWVPTELSEPLWEVGVGRNPHDVALCGQHLFISIYDEDHLEVREPESGDWVADLDLASLADADGIPEASRLEVLDGRLYVGLHLFDREHVVDGRWLSAGGVIAEVDCEALEVSRTWEPGPAPDLFAHPEGDALVVRTGTWWEPDGVLAEWTPDDGAGEPWLAEADLPGEDLLYYAGTPEWSLVVGVGEEPDFESVVHCLDAQGQLTGTVRLEASLWDAVADPAGQVWTPAGPALGDAESSTGLIRWDSTCALPASGDWVSTALPPYDVDFVL